MIINPLTKYIRKHYSGSNNDFLFTKHRNPDFNAQEAEKIHFYIHIPFCNHCCPYCPYNKVLVNNELAKQFFEALHFEIELYFNLLGSVNIKSIYFGGGSPAIFGEEINEVIQHLSKRFNIKGEICIEINPNDCSLDNLELLKATGIKTVSVGLQSFQPENLTTIGRAYNEQVAESALQKAVSIFDTVNVDLMFALPTQNKKNVISDLKKAMGYGVNQITTYPLFTFPYTEVGKYRKLKKVKMPGLKKRKKQYYSIYDTLLENGYSQASVWSFKKGEGEKYSSVTRDGYLGLGAGAGSHFSTGYYLNTFSIEAYVKSLKNGEFPTAMKFALNERLNNLFWLYWRFYDTRIPITEFKKRFESDNSIKKLLSFLSKTSMIKEVGDEFQLSKKGSFWLHLAQNYFSLSYIDKIWSKAMIDDFPDEIKF